MNTYLFQVTDTVNGEANYCWARHYKVAANTISGAIRKVNRQEGFPRLDLVMKGEVCRWNVRNACICIFGEEWSGFDQLQVYKDLK